MINRKYENAHIVKTIRLGRYEYPEAGFKTDDGKDFEGVKGRLVRDRRVRPRLPENLQNRYKCPDCGSWLNDEFKGHFACENCPYVAWDKPIPEHKT